ncbi:MAG: type II toxin-antitoxin system VapC family toxin [Nitrospirota bacterium]
MKGFILDSYALIAYFEDEPGADNIEKVLMQAERGRLDLLMSIVNWGEVYYSIYRSKGEGKAEESLLIIEQLPIKVVEVDKKFMHRVARLKATNSIAIGDCFAAALAINMDYPVLTGDKEFEKLKHSIKIEWI